MPYPHGQRYHRTPPPLPDPSTLPFPGNLIRLCTDCGLRAKCKAPVPGDGAVPAEVALVGEGPGRQEDEWGYKPFVGQAGQYLNSLLFQVGLPRESVYATNVVHCHPPGNRTPKPDEVRACAHWLDLELSLVQPRIIMALGATAIARFLGNNAGTVEHLHGKPIEKDGVIILPAYHPAFALHDTSKTRQVSEDFQVLRGLVKGADWRSYHVVDEYPNPDYRVADTPAKLRQMRDEISDSGEFAVDTEQCRGKLWSVQISARPGTAWFIPIPDDFRGRYDLTDLPGTAIVHYWLHDIQYVVLREDDFIDTMVEAYLLHLPQGLKELASRLCGVQMKTYREVVRPGQQELSLEYLLRASGREWPDPPLIEETKWNNKKGELVTRNKKPWHISRKINGIINDFSADENTDLWDRWRNIPAEERAVVEDVLSLMPESSLADIDFDQAVQYSARDPDVTLRVHHKMRKMIADLDLNFVEYTDLGILPMVDSMMANGMAVDIEHCRRLSEDYDVRMRVQAAELAGMVGHAFNPNSSQQVAAVIYGELGFKPTKTTATGLISTDDAELKKTGHPVAEGVIRYRGLMKLKSTYADNMIRSAHPDESGTPRMHTVIKTTRVETGRLSSSKNDEGEGANLQNIPTRNKESKAIKNGFIAPPGWLLAELDYGQIEMRTQAHLAQCKGLIELFNRGGDPHTETAARLFGVSLDQAKLTKYRYPTKRAGFGIIYLIGPHGLSTQINEYIADLAMDGESVDIEPWDELTCEKFIAEYYRLYPEIRSYQYAQVAHARRYGYVKDLFGRIRYIPEVHCPIRAIKEAGARQAANMPVTATAQEIIKAAMGELWRSLPQTEWADSLRWEMQVHDSLIVEVVEDEEVHKPCLRWVEDNMTNVVSLLVPVVVDTKVGKRWGSLEKVVL